MDYRAWARARWPLVRHRAVYVAVVIRNRWRRLVWTALTPAGTSHRLEPVGAERVVATPFAGLVTVTGDGTLDDRLAAETRVPVVSWSYRYAGDLLIEPRYGYAIDRPLRLLDESMPYSEWSRDPAARNLIGFPGPASVALARIGARRVVPARTVISLRFYWDDNYYHFLNDILPRLHVANLVGVPKDVPVVVGRKLSASRYFREICTDGTLDGHPVIEQGDDFVGAECAYFFRPPPDLAGIAFVADLLGAPARPAGARRIFVTRAAGRGRSIVNLDELRSTLDEFGFEVVDTDGWSLADQVALFSSAEHIAGIHGAGLANMIFRRGAPCSVLEIFSPGEALGFYAHLSSRLGFAYGALAGFSAERLYDRRQPFRVDPARFREQLADAVSRGPQALAPTA